MREEVRGIFHGIKIGTRAPSISHLMLTDDTIFYRRATKEEVSGTWKCVGKYLDWTGQKVNLHKLGLIFSKNCMEERKDGINAMLNMKECNRDAKHLEMPLFLGRNRIALNIKKLRCMIILKVGWLGIFLRPI